ncbi:MAG: hypothetical protein EBS53_12645, partial [Bacteroidetes bacterium]|nr:hypothetical protein [Bacteroidota bacterium]
MKKSLLLLFVFLMTVTAHAQFRLFNSPPLSTNNGSSGASFNMRANSSVFIDTFFVPLYGTIGSTTTVEVWYNTTPNNGTIPNMANPGWTQIVSSPGVPILNSGFSGITQFAPVVIPGGFMMNAGDHFAFALGRATTATGSMAYTSWVAGSLDTFTDGTLTMYTGSGIGYGGAWPNLNIASRQFTGGLSYRMAAGLDLRPSALISPIPPVAGSNTFTFRFQNAASDPVTSGDLGLMVNNNPPVFLNGYTFTGLGNPGGVENVTFPTSFTLNAGSSVLVKVWGKNANGLGPDSNPNNDTLTLNLTVPGVVISIASGNWSSPSTWNVGRAPNVLDNVIVSTGHTVTSDLANQTCAKLTVDGIFTFGATPADFRIMSDLQVNAGGLVNVFQGTTGKILRIGGNLTNNGRINNSIGTTAVGTINLFGSSMQTVSGSGLFGGTVSSTTTTNDAGVINILVIENTAPGWPNIDWQIPGTIRFKGGLNLQRGKINLNGNTWILGNYTTAPTLTCPDTCGVMNGTLGRWFATGTGGTTVTAGTV